MGSNTKKTMTVEELLEITADQLENITGIPVSLANSVSRPIWEAVQNIRECLKAIRKQQEQEKEPETDDEKEGGGTDGEGNGI